MEEIVTVDGKQFKLSTDRPLTALERQQTIAQIRQQTGCGTCHQPRTLSSGGVYSLPFNNTELTGIGTTDYQSDQTVTLRASPDGGVAPYYVKFWKSRTGAAPLDNTGIVNASLSTQVDGATAEASYTLLDADVAEALGNSTAGVPISVDVGSGTIGLSATVYADLPAGSIRFYSSVVDSCTGGSKGTCAQYADVALACAAPTCNFVVT